MQLNLEQARKRAKELVRSGRAATLAEAQHEIAPELGYASWPKLVHAFDRTSIAARFVELAGEDGGRARELLEANPEIRADPWVALTLGDASVVRDATRPGGPLARPPLFYVARSRVEADTVSAAKDLISRRADPNGPGGEEWTNLSIACARGDPPIARLLIEAGAIVDDNDSLYHSVEPADDACLRDYCSSTARRCPARTLSITRSTTSGSSRCDSFSYTAVTRASTPTGPRSITPSHADVRPSSCGCSSPRAPIRRRATRTVAPPTSRQFGAEAPRSPRRYASSARRPTSSTAIAR